LAPHQIGERIDTQNNDQIKFGAGYDHTFVINKTPDNVFHDAGPYGAVFKVPVLAGLTFLGFF
jgi:hypothetical protein